MTIISCCRASLVVGFVAALTALGCNSEPDAPPVSGKVSYKGAAPSSGVISFVQSGSPPKNAIIEAGGAYQINLPPGEYQVRIDTPPPMPDGWKEGDPLPPPGPRVVPEKFANFTTSGLKATVTGEAAQELDFALQ